MRELQILAARKQAASDAARFAHYLEVGDVANATIWHDFSHASWCKLAWLVEHT